MRLGDFILVNMERILGEWELFAVTIVPSALGMDSSSLRNHAKLMLQAIALDLSQGQSEEQQQRKSVRKLCRDTCGVAASFWFFDRPASI